MLEQKLTEAKSKKDTLKARAKTAQSSRQINEMIQGLNTSNAMTAFERMEEKVMSLEAESDATLQVATLPRHLPPASCDMIYVSHVNRQCRLYCLLYCLHGLAAAHLSVRPPTVRVIKFLLDRLMPLTHMFARAVAAGGDRRAGRQVPTAGGRRRGR